MASKSSSDANLENLVKAGSLHAEPTSRDEVKRLLADAEESLRDSRTATLGAGSRFRLAYSAAFAFAMAALRANGYRPVQGKGHRAIAFQVLEHTCGTDKAVMITLVKSHERRNAAEYEGAPAISESEAKNLVGAVEVLRLSVRDWLKKHRRDLS